MADLEKRFLPLYQSIVQYPGRWLLAWVLAISALLATLLVKTDYLESVVYHNGPYIYFTEDNQDFQRLRGMEQTYATDTSLIFLLAPDDGDIFTAANLQAIEKLTELAWTLPYVVRVDSLSNFQHTRIANDELITEYLYEDAETLSLATIDQIRTIALSEKSLIHQSLSPQGNAASVVARLTLDEAQTRALEVVPLAEEIVANIESQYPELKIMLLGDAPNAAASEEATQETFRKITPVSMALVFLCLIFLLRNMSSVLVCQLIIGLSIVLGYSIFMLGGFGLSPISAGASPIILTLAVADAIHILISYQFQSNLGKSKQQAMLESLRINFSPVWLTSVTTGMGFLFMNFAEAPPFHDLGNAVFFGVMMAFLLSTTLLPALMMFLPQPKAKNAVSRKRFIKGLALFTIKQRRGLLMGTSFIVLLLVSCIPLNRVNDILLEYFDETFQVRRALDFHFEQMGGLQRLQYAVPARGEGGVAESEYLTNLDKLARWAESHPKVSHVRTFSEVVKRLNRNMHNGDPEYYRIPEDKRLISQYVLLYELGLPFGLGLDAQVDIQKSETKLEIIFNRLESSELVEMRKEIDQWISNNWPKYMYARATGMDSLFSDITFENVYSMLIGTILALVTVSVLLIITLRSFRYGLLSLIPNLLPAAMTFGFWGIIHGELGIVVSIIACMTLGIIVDDTVHFLSKYVRARKEMNLDHREAAVYAFETVGMALIATSIILVANFIVMSFSHYYPNAATGILTSITITFALLIDFFFFVPLLLVMDGGKNEPHTNKAPTLT